MPLYTDQTGRIIQLAAAPQRIVSLVPSQTELLFHLGLDQEVVGITRFCVHPPEWFRSKTRIGGTKQIKMELVEQLAPDLILANKEENNREQVEALSTRFPVWVSDISNFREALNMIEAVGSLTQKKEDAASLLQNIQQEFDSIQPLFPRLPAAYLIWKDPYMSVGGDTFISDLLKRCGFENVFGHLTRYPTVTVEDLQKAHPSIVLLSSEPYPFRQQHLEELQAELPGSRILLADGEMFSWYGSRLLYAPAYFNKLLSATVSEYPKIN